MTEKTREDIIKEIYESELKYVNDLTDLLEIYHLPLKNSKLVPASDMKLIFGGVELIKNLNSTLLVDIKLVYGKEKKKFFIFFKDDMNGSNGIGKIFKKFAPFLKQYTDYCGMYEEVANKLEGYKKKKKKIAKFIKKIEKKQYKTCGITLLSYLVMPVQRLPRYSILLQVIFFFFILTHFFRN